MNSESQIVAAQVDAHDDAFFTSGEWERMSADRVANRLFLEVCYHFHCELRDWYDDGLSLMETLTTKIEKPINGARGCNCDDSTKTKTQFVASPVGSEMGARPY